MLSKTEIANLALSNVGVAKEIANITTEQSQEAGACRRYFDIALNTTLRDFHWPCATKFQALALVSEDHASGWAYAYRYPSDCLDARKILFAGMENIPEAKVPFERAVDTTGGLILTNFENAVLEYTMVMTNTVLLAPDVIAALGFRLGAYIAPRVTGGDPFKLSEKCLQLYQLELNKAKANALRERQASPAADSEFVRTR